MVDATLEQELRELEVSLGKDLKNVGKAANPALHLEIAKKRTRISAIHKLLMEKIPVLDPAPAVVVKQPDPVVPTPVAPARVVEEKLDLFDITDQV